LDAKLARVLLYGLLARYGRAVLHHHHFKVFDSLACQAFKQFVHLFGAVIHGYDDRVFHAYSK
jgi:hypothetical protein